MRLRHSLRWEHHWELAVSCGEPSLWRLCRPPGPIWCWVKSCDLFLRGAVQKGAFRWGILWPFVQCHNSYKAHLKPGWIHALARETRGSDLSVNCCSSWCPGWVAVWAGCCVIQPLWRKWVTGAGFEVLQSSLPCLLCVMATASSSSSPQRCKVYL